MKFLSPVLVLAAVTSATVAPRDLATVIDIMTPILDGLHHYDGVLKAYSHTLDPWQLQYGGIVMITAIDKATMRAQQMPPLTLSEAYGFQPLSNELNAAGDIVIYDLGNMTTRFEAGKVCWYIRPHVELLADKVDNLMKTVASKFPAAGQSHDSATIEHFEVGFAATNAALSHCSDL